MAKASRKTRRSFLQHSALVLAGASIAPHAAFGISTSKKKKGHIVGHGEFRYLVDKQWGVQDLADIPVKDCHEMVMDQHKRLILLTNHTRNNIIVYDKSGKVIKTWTLNLPGAHGLTLAREGSEEFLFITDTDLGKVFKTTLDGKVLLELQAPPQIYAQPAAFKPTETAVAPNGDFYVADGYGENYIIQYSAGGEYIRHWGGKGDGPGQFDCCHGVTLDTRNAARPELLITSRSKHEFKRFTLDGRHLETIALPGHWICRPVIAGEQLYFAVLVTQSWGSYDGMVAVLNRDNKVVSFPGGSAPEYRDGVLQPSTYDDMTFLNPHDVCVDDETNLYVPQWASGRTYPVKLERI